MKVQIFFASPMSRMRWGAVVSCCFCLTSPVLGQSTSELALPTPAPGVVRVASFNTALNRKEAGQLVQDLKQGDEQAKRIATIVQLVQPDVLLANEVDYSDGEAAKILLNEYFKKPQNGKLELNACHFGYFYTAAVNTGVNSGLDLNLNGRTTDSDDSWGYGAFPGQYGMAVYSKYPISESAVRSFQMFKWSEMPNAKRPKLVDKATGAETFFHSDAVWKQLRLSSKSHWDVPIKIGESTLHVIASHPTPPVFDGPEDRNGCRNHDEIRLIQDYVEGTAEAGYIVDDNGIAGPLARTAQFVILGDLNADPNDGSGIAQGILHLLSSKRVSANFVPASQGGVEASKLQGKANEKHKGNPANDTGDFNDNSAGNLRIDFVLPSSDCQVVGGGVFWPTADQLREVDPKLVEASDHHLVWLDIQLSP